jgi:cell division protein FtsI/penicillin-binding protein 2
MISKPRYKRSQDKNYRLHILMAFVFFLAILIVFKLSILQIFNTGYYQALAESQHSAYDKLEPKRGTIFLQDNKNDGAELYPMATNKEFANLYAVPKEVTEASEIADFLYEIFDKESIEKEVDSLLEDDEYFSQLLFELAVDDWEDLDAAEASARQQFLEVKRDLEIELRSKEKIENYRKKLSKKNDPYEPLARKVPEEKLNLILAKNYQGIYYTLEDYRYYPENNIGSHWLGFVGQGAKNMLGRYGLEGFFNYELSGLSGEIKGEKSGQGGVIIINNREYLEPQNGKDLILTINRSIQYAVCQELKNSIEQFDAEGGTVLVMEPYSGAIIAMCSLPDYNPNSYSEVEDTSVFNNPAIFESYEPGSIFKTITMAAGLDKGAIKPDTIFEDKGYLMVEGWDKAIKNSDFDTHGGHGWVDMITVLEESLNTGAIFAMEKIGYEDFSKYVKDFGFGEKTGIELETEGLSNIKNLLRNRIRPVEAATASFGQGITATPLQVVAAYSAIANGGILMKPYLVQEIINEQGEREITQPKQIRRVISDKAAYSTSGMLVNVVDGGHAKLAGVSGYFVAGKTGTAQVADKEKGGYSENQTIHTFVGFAPIDEPRFVMLTKLVHPKNAPYAASTAAPLFGKLAEFILNYYQVPKER